MDILKKSIIVVFFLLSITILARVFFVGNYLDFNSFYFATKVYFSGGNPYGQLSGASVGFLYAPTPFLFFSPFIVFPLKVAELLWTSYSVVLLVVSVILLFKIAKRDIFSYEFLGILGAVCMMFPVKFTLGMGQVGILNLFLVVLFLYFISQNKEKLSGIVLSLCLLLKFFPLLFPVYLIILTKWRIFIISSLVSMIVAIFVFLYRPDQMIYFVTKSLPGTLGSWPTAYYNQALSGMIGRWMGRGEDAQLLKLGVIIFAVTLTLYILWKKRKRIKDDHLLSYVSLLPLSVIIAPLAWQHYFVLVIPTFVTLYFFYKKNKTGIIRYGLLGISYLLVASNIKDTQGVLLLVQSHVLWGAMVLWGLTLYEIWKYK